MAYLASPSLVVIPPNSTSQLSYGMPARSAPNQANSGKTNLFVGDLSTFCSEDDLSALFSQFGEVVEVKIMKSEETKRNLAYGFVKFADTASAKNALVLNGSLFQGRNMKVNWAEFRNKLNPKEEGQEELSTSPVHVSFISYQIEHLVNEQSLRLLFSQFGEVKDVTIKKSQIERDLRRQSGYGFVHFDITREGIEAATRAAEALKDTTIDDVNYKSSPSHSLCRRLNHKDDTPLSASASTPASAPAPASAGVGSSSAPETPTLLLQHVWQSTPHGAQSFAAPPHENNNYGYSANLMQPMQPMQSMQPQMMYSDAHAVSYSPVLASRSLPLAHAHPHAPQMIFSHSHNQLSHQSVPAHLPGGAAPAGISFDPQAPRYVLQDGSNAVFVQAMPAVHHAHGYPSPSPYSSAPIPVYPLQISPSLPYRMMAPVGPGPGPAPSTANAHAHAHAHPQWLPSPSMSPNVGPAAQMREEQFVGSLLQSPSPAQRYTVSPFASYAPAPYPLDQQSPVSSYQHDPWARGPEIVDRSGSSPSTSTASMPFNSDVVMSSALNRNSTIAGKGSSTRQAGNRLRSIMNKTKIGPPKESDDQSSETDNR